jgi:DNA-binding IclR family transcriptional regulator
MTERSALSPLSGAAAETSIWRALRVVDAVAEAGDGVTPKAIARRLGFSLPTTYRLLATMVGEGYLVRLPDLRGYGLGYRTGQLARRLLDQMAAPWPVQSVLHGLHQRIGAVAYYAVLRGNGALLTHLDDCPEHPGPDQLRPGSPIPAPTSAVGKVLLASVDRRRLAGLVNGAQRENPGGLARELQRVRELGVVTEMDDPVPGRASVAAPVRTHGAVVGALAVCVARADLANRQAQLELTLRNAAARASDALADQAVG